MEKKQQSQDRYHSTLSCVLVAHLSLLDVVIQPKKIFLDMVEKVLFIKSGISRREGVANPVILLCNQLEPFEQIW